MNPENLIVKYLSNEATEEEIDELYIWLAESEKNQKLLTDYMNIYERSYENKITYNMEGRLKELKDRMRPTTAQKPVRTIRHWALRVAASFLILATVALAFYSFNNESNENEIPLITKSNPNGFKSTFQFPDGTIVKLNAGSTLKYPEQFNDTKRLVSLEGEAFFDVVRDESRPFIVQSKDISTTVLGTSFNINASDDLVTVAVATGRVQVEGGGKKVLLTPGEMASYRDNQLSQSTVNLEKRLAWKDNILIFENASLSYVVAELEKWYGIAIKNDVENKECLFTGRFENENLINVLEALKFSIGINYEKENKKVELSGLGCK